MTDYLQRLAVNDTRVASLELFQAEAALQSESVAERIPIREVHVAWCRYRLACTPNYPEAEQIIAEAIRAVEAIAGRARFSSDAWFRARIQLGHMLIGSVSLLRLRCPTEVVGTRLERAAALAQEASNAARRAPGRGDEWAQSTSLAVIAAQAAFQILGDISGLRRAIVHADALADAGGTPLDTALTTLSLRLMHFEVTGEREDLIRGIQLAERLLAQLQPSAARDRNGDSPGFIATESRTDQIRDAQEHLAKFLTFHALEQRRTVGRGTAQEAALAADCQRAVQLARAVSEASGMTTFQQGLAANTLGMALRAQAIVTGDLQALGAAVLALLRATQCVGVQSPAGVLFANNAATAMGDLAEIAPTLRVSQSGTVLDDALAILEEALEQHVPDRPHADSQLLETKFNYARLALRRAARGGPVRDLTRAARAIEGCIRSLMSGHRQRAHALSIGANIWLAQYSVDSDPGHLRAALEATLEAEAIIASGAPTADDPSDVGEILERWRRCGGHDIELREGRIRATRKLVDALPEFAAALANRRTLAALTTRDPVCAADYADIAVRASSRALIVADDLDLAYHLAGTVGEISALHRAAVAIARQEPDRAVMLLERSQANSIGRLQLSLEVLEATAANDTVAVKRYLAARAALRTLVKARRESRMVATAEALRDADAEFESSIQKVRQLPGMSQFLLQITNFSQLQKLGSPCVFIVAGGADGGMAILVHTVGPPQAISLPLLSEEAVASQVASHLAALTLFESEGTVELARFQQSLRVSVSWLEEAVIGPLREHMQREHICFIPCGSLCNLPWSAATAAQPITYAPSVQICARSRNSVAEYPYLLICEPKHEGASELPGAVGLHAWIEHLVGEPVTLLRGADATPDAVLHEATRHQRLLFYAHGTVRQDDPLGSGILLHGTSRLDIRTIMANPQSFVGRTIILASCSQGHLDPRVPSQMLGPATAFLAAGARTVVAPGWPVEATSARIVATALVEALTAGLYPEAALVAAQNRLRNAGTAGEGSVAIAGLRRGRPLPDNEVLATDLSFAHPFFSGAFAVYGSIHGTD